MQANKSDAEALALPLAPPLPVPLAEWVWGQWWRVFCVPVSWTLSSSAPDVHRVCSKAGCPSGAAEALQTLLDAMSIELRRRTSCLEIWKVVHVWLWLAGFLLVLPVSIGVGVALNSGAALGGIMGAGVLMLTAAYLNYACSVRGWEETLVKNFVASHQAGLPALSERVGLRLQLGAVLRSEGSTRNASDFRRRNKYRWRPVLSAFPGECGGSGGGAA